MIDLESIKKNYYIVEIARRLGIEVSRDNKALCPFHNDTRPSLSFNIKENYYHCFSCGEGGDNIKLVMEVLHCDFNRALEFITGESFNNSKIKEKNTQKKVFKKCEEKNKSKSTIIAQNIKTSNIYDTFINALEENDAIKYLEKRRITKEQVIKNKIKNIPKEKEKQEELIKKLLSEFSEESLIQSGIVSKKNNSLYLFHYKHRLILPYFEKENNQKKIVSIQGRNIDDNETNPKYLFNKNSVSSIYNIEKLDNYSKDIVLCEGVIDALSLERLGFDTIAISGASKYSLIENNEMLKNYNIYIFSDEDNAGNTLIKNLYNLDNFKGKFLLDKLLLKKYNTKKIKDINELLTTVEIKTFKIENIVYNYFEMPNEKICILDYAILKKEELKKLDKNNFDENLKNLIKQKKEKVN